MRLALTSLNLPPPISRPLAKHRRHLSAQLRVCSREAELHQLGHPTVAQPVMHVRVQLRQQALRHHPRADCHYYRPLSCHAHRTARKGQGGGQSDRDPVSSLDVPHLHLDVFGRVRLFQV